MKPSSPELEAGHAHNRARSTAEGVRSLSCGLPFGQTRQHRKDSIGFLFGADPRKDCALPMCPYSPLIPPDFYEFPGRALQKIIRSMPVPTKIPMSKAERCCRLDFALVVFAGGGAGAGAELSGACWICGVEGGEAVIVGCAGVFSVVCGVCEVDGEETPLALGADCASGVCA